MCVGIESWTCRMFWWLSRFYDDPQGFCCHHSRLCISYTYGLWELAWNDRLWSHWLSVLFFQKLFKRTRINMMCLSLICDFIAELGNGQKEVRCILIRLWLLLLKLSCSGASWCILLTDLLREVCKQGLTHASRDLWVDFLVHDCTVYIAIA
jgi:hypothetical protein